MSETNETEQKEKGKHQPKLVAGVAFLLGGVFLLAPIFKLVTWSATVEQFEQFGYEPWFIIVTVLVELASAVLVVVPLTRYWGATLITIVMVVAFFSHLKANEISEMLPPFILLVLANVITWCTPTKPAEEDAASQATA